MKSRVLIMVLDAFCGDMLSDRLTPNLQAFAREWTSVPAARSVFPSETRVCASSLTSGCWPERHGITANYQFLPPDGRLFNSGLPEDLREWKKRLSELAPCVPPVPNLGRALAGAGRSLLTVAAASDGCCCLLDWNAAALGHTRLVVRTPSLCTPEGSYGNMVRDFGPVPPVREADGTYSPALMAYTVSVLLGRIEADSPDAALCWLPEPDMAGHLFGTRSRQHDRALSVIDKQCGRVMAWWEEKGREQGWQLLFMADHGMDDAGEQRDLPEALRAAGFNTRVSEDGQAITAVMDDSTFRILNASSGHARLDGPCGEKPLRALLDALKPLCHDVFLADALLQRFPVPGVRPLSGTRCSHALGPQIRFTLAGTNGGPAAPSGSVKIGFHGGCGKREMNPLLLAGGELLRPRYESLKPSALPDIAPTVLTMLGVPVPERMQGRVLTELFADRGIM
ncbi:alkaline phosphatase family protein [uncultured Mailhella sp.]|uniref:alkaline phosphatase family protein n=1 Tax=uncultured Mailhella sp. TaxID=1981031 RepID=UPI0025D47440|nr:alkaline phosphatase family protein [uncultured Mailhella sp.]